MQSNSHSTYPILDEDDLFSGIANPVIVISTLSAVDTQRGRKMSMSKKHRSLFPSPNTLRRKRRHKGLSLMLFASVFAVMRQDNCATTLKRLSIAKY